MAFTTGTATHLHDLMDKLRLWLVTQGWTQEQWTPAPGGLGTKSTLCMRAPGGGAGRRPFCYFESLSDLGLPYYTIGIHVASGYSASTAWLSQSETSPQVFLASSNNTMTYRFYANSRRVIIVTKIATSYVSAYAGMYLPFALPSEFERPFYVGASSNNVTFSAASNSNLSNHIADPGTNSAYVLTPQYNWRSMENRQSSGTDISCYSGNSLSACLWPKKSAPNSSGTDSGDGSFTGLGFEYLRPNANGESPMFQCTIIDNNYNSNYGAVLGSLDGVYAISGFNRVTEQLLTIGALKYRAFQNTIRSSNNHFMAIGEI